MRIITICLVILALPLMACAQEAEPKADNTAGDMNRDYKESLATVTQDMDDLLAAESKIERRVTSEKIWQEVNAEQHPNDPNIPPLTSDGLISLIDSESISCKGVAQQGGLVVCRTAPKTKVKISRSEKDFYYETSDDNGVLFVGFDRDEIKTEISVKPMNGVTVEERFNFETREYDISRINGLPKNMVSEYTEAELKRIRAASAKKKKAFASRAAEVGFKDGFIFPIQAEYIKTTNFGAQRILNGDPKKPHYGVDMAAPAGTPIVAPADGVVTLADEDMYFEGALIMIDHGQGLISYYLHMDDVMVENGQRVTQGDQIATVGSKGRSTGPHLCWRLKWRNRNLDPELLTAWPSEASLP